MQSPEPFGDYVLIERVAMGGMAELFRAQPIAGQNFPSEVCVKRILPHYSDDEAFINMFIDEATIAAKLQHPNIVQIYEFNVYDGCYFIAMELIHGKDLKQSLEIAFKKRARMPDTMVGFVMRAVADSLHHAHSRIVDGKPMGLVHRDVSPHNILISFQGDIKLTDFGIAKATSRLTHTQAGTVKGKCAYMSPEQTRGKTLDGRSDMFSAGILMHEMLTGRRLFTGESDFDILTKVLKQPIEPPSNYAPVDPPLERICMRALERDRDKRFRDCGEMARAIDAWLRTKNVTAENVGLASFMQGLYGMANVALPAMTGHASADAQAVADLPTQMFALDNIAGAPQHSAPGYPQPSGFANSAPNYNSDGNSTAIFDPNNPPPDPAFDGHQPAPVPHHPSGHIPHITGQQPRVSGHMPRAPQQPYHGGVPHPHHPPSPAPHYTGTNATPPPAQRPPIVAIVAVLGLAFVILSAVIIGLIIYLKKPELFKDGETSPKTVAVKEPKRIADDKDDDPDENEKPSARSTDREGDPDKNEKPAPKTEDRITLTVTSDPIGAALTVNGTDRGKTPVILDDLRDKDRIKIKLTLEGYHDEVSSTAVTLSTDGETLSFPLRKNEEKPQEDTLPNNERPAAGRNAGKWTPKNSSKGTGTVSINAIPWANVYLDGRKLGRTPITNKSIPAGSHNVILKNPDFKANYRKSFRVDKDGRANIFYNFNR